MRTVLFCLCAAIALSACAAHEPLPDAGSPNGRNDATAPDARSVFIAPSPQEKALEIVDDPPLNLYPILDGAPLMQTPSNDSPLLEILRAEERLIRFRLRGIWSKVMVPTTGRMGWIETRLLTRQPPQQDSTPGDGTISETF